MALLHQGLVGRYKNIRHFLTSVKEVIRHGYPTRKLKVIGVTGTDGKTTTAHLISEILRRAGKKTAVISTIGAFIDNEIINTGSHVTNPDATVLQPLLKKMVDKRIEYTVIETTSHGLDQHRVLGCNFLVGVLTNVTHEHLDYHKTFERYKGAKRKLFRGVKFAILNKDDSSFEYFAQATKKNASIISYSLKKGANLSALNIKPGIKGTIFTVQERTRKYEIQTSLVGYYNVSNILAAVGAVRALDIGWREIKKAVREFKNVAGRMEEINLDQPFRVIVDFAHTPNALKNLLKTLVRMKKEDKRLITIIGSAGERDVLKRPLLGGVATQYSDITIFTADDPRREDVNAITKQMIKGTKTTGAVEAIKADLANPHAPKKNRYVVEPDRKKAIELAISIAQKDDIVAICGMGHQRSIAVGSIEIPWSDPAVAEKILKKYQKSPLSKTS